MKRTTVINGGTATTNYYIFDAEHWVLEYNASNVNLSNVLYGRGIDEVIARGVNGQGWFYFPDRNGNISVVTDGVNLVRESYRYDAFGAPTVTVGAGQQPINNRFLFTGREWNATYGFYEYRARAYNPTIGRFMSEDPKGFDAGDYNLYRYVGNDPLDRVDPMGLEDMIPPPHMDELGREASLSSAVASQGRGAFGRAIEQVGNGPLRLGPLTRGTLTTQRVYQQGRLIQLPRLVESYTKSDDAELRGAGHVHNNLTGLPAPHERLFSTTDYDLTKNQGKWNYVVNQSDKTVLYRLNPQTDKRDSPTVSKLDINTLESRGTFEVKFVPVTGSNIPQMQLVPKYGN